MSVHLLPDGRWQVRYRKGVNRIAPDKTKEYFGRGKDAERAARARDAELKGTRRQEKLSPQFFELANGYMLANAANISTSDMKNLLWKLKGIIGPIVRLE